MRWIETVMLIGSLAGIGACHPGESLSSDSGRQTELFDTVWYWQEFQDSADGEEASDISVPDPEKYTLTLAPAGGAQIRADCNQLSWTYTLEDSRLSFNSLGPGTLAYCGDESLDQSYLERLSHTATYVLDDNKLYLNLKADAGNLVFYAGN